MAHLCGQSSSVSEPADALPLLVALGAHSRNGFIRGITALPEVEIIPPVRLRLPQISRQPDRPYGAWEAEATPRIDRYDAASRDATTGQRARIKLARRVRRTGGCSWASDDRTCEGVAGSTNSRRGSLPAAEDHRQTRQSAWGRQETHRGECEISYFGIRSHTGLMQEERS